ncbi:MAG TPA: hypothetical protein VHE34_16980 [Puia sp.]|uniref:hypothetical protein n=1 Tax=Puia sp. TaxID=2045100 RepID=UPI002B956FD8|nr:hypothetical protein [Puia sp.]HVU96928.1 hypothetical protein [Puia sp.]
MIAYDRQSLDNLDLQQHAREAFEKGLITLEEYDRIRATYPYSFYLPNFFIRLGLFVVTVIAAAAVLGLFLLGGMEGQSTLILGSITILVLELFIHQRKMNGSGVDDALLWVAVILFLAGIDFIGTTRITPAVESGLVLVLACIAVLRYADHGMTLAAYGAFLCLVFFTVGKWGPVARALLPFLVMSLSIGCYFLFTGLYIKTAFRHYRSCLYLLRLTTLLSLYASGNYYVVHELNGTIAGGGGPISLAWLWWSLTAIIPVFYIVKGVQKKDVLWLWTGMGLVAASILTVRYYYHLLPTEIAMLIGGIVLIAGVYGLTRWLRTPKHGFTAAAAGQPHPLADGLVEGLIIAESFREVAVQPADGGTHFGGGDTGGGGAGSQY